MDILRKPFTDLSNPRTQTSFLERVRDGSYFAVILSPPCSTFSRAPWRNRRGPRPIRSHDYPDGLPGLRWAERRKARLGNTLADFSLRTATAALDLPCAFALLEQPEDLGAVAIGRRPSSMWQRPLFQAVVGHPNAQHVVFHQADFGTPYPKPTRLLLRTRQALPAGMRSGLPNFDSQGFYTGPLPRHPTARPMQPLRRPALAHPVLKSGPQLSVNGWRGAFSPISAPRLALGISRRRLHRRLRLRMRRWGKRGSSALILWFRRGQRTAWATSR